jgi:hypothetical protein
MQIHLDARDLVDLAKVRLPALQKQIPFAMAGALNDVMYASRTAIMGEMAKVFDRPTPYVLRSLRYRKASKSDLAFELWSEEFGRTFTPAQVLQAEITGGGRPMKRSEIALGSYWVPGEGAKLDRYGNVRGADISAMLSALKLSNDPMQNRTRRSRAKAVRRGALRNYFRQGNIIYLRNGRRIAPFLVLTKAPSYHPRLAFEGKVTEILKSGFAEAFKVRFGRAVETAKAG